MGTLALLKWTEIYLRTRQIPTCHINFNLRTAEKAAQESQKAKTEDTEQMEQWL